MNIYHSDTWKDRENRKSHSKERRFRLAEIKADFPLLMARFVVLALAVASASLKPACADVLVSYTGDPSYVTVDTNFSRLATRTGSAPNYTFKNAFSDTTVLSPITGYTGPAFYGGYQYKILNDPNTPTIEPTRQQVRNEVGGAGKPDMITFQDTGYRPGFTPDWTGATLSFQAAIVFELSGLSSVSDMSAKVSNSSLNANFTSGASWRWIVQSGGNYYVSQDTFANTAGTPALSSLSDPSSELWAIYTPSLSLDFDQSSATYTTLDLGNITAAGLYLECDSWAGDSSTQSMNAVIQSFSVNGMAVPETSSASLLTVGILLLVGIYKRRLKSSEKALLNVL